MKKKVTTVIEITEAHVKFLQAKTLRGRRVITKCDIRPIEHHPDDELRRILRDLTLSKNINPNDLTVIIPRRLTILKQLRLPSVHEDEIKKMVGLQLIHQIPYSMEDIVYDYRVIEKEPSGYTKILVVVVHKDVSRQFLEIFHWLGIQLGKLAISSQGLLNWLLYQESKKKIEARIPVVLINMDLMHTEICFCDDKKILFSRSINYGMKDIQADFTVDLMNQIELSLKAYEKETMGPEIKKIFLLSPPYEMTAFQDKLQERLKIPVEIMSPFENILSQKNLNLGSMRDQSGLSLGVGLGFLIYETKRPINLMSQEVHETKKDKLKRRQWIKFSFLLLLIVMAGAAVLGVEIYQKTNRLNLLKEKVETLKPLFEEAQKKINFVNFFKEEFKERILVPDLLSELYDLTPDEISYRSIYLNEKGEMTILGYAQMSSSVNSFQSGLVKSPVFKDVNLQFATKRKIFQNEVTDFKITCLLIDKEDREP